MRVLLIAPFASKHSVGEGNSAYQLISRLAQFLDITLLTYRLRSDPSAREDLPTVEVVEWTDIPVAGRFPRVNSQLTPGYLYFYLQARRWIQRNLVRTPPLLVHQIAPLALRYPCPAVGLSAPYIVGPLGGSLEVPAPMLGHVQNEPLYRRLRRFDGLRFRYDPWLRATYSGAKALLLVAPYVKELLADIPLPRVEYLSEAGVEATFPRSRPEGYRREQARLLYVGRVIRTKGVRDAILALSRLKSPLARLDIVGDGEDLKPCQSLAMTLGLGDRVHFHGHIDSAKVTEFYKRADLFVFPSFREPSGKALLEAMSHGLPVIAANHGGPAAVVDSDCGILVEPAEPLEFAQRLGSSIDQVLTNEELYWQLSRGACKRVEARYTWNSKVKWLLNFYQEVLNQRSGSLCQAAH